VTTVNPQATSTISTNAQGAFGSIGDIFVNTLGGFADGLLRERFGTPDSTATTTADHPTNQAAQTSGLSSNAMLGLAAGAVVLVALIVALK